MQFQPNIQSMMNSLFREMGIALVISLFKDLFLLYIRKIYFHLHIQCVVRIALCISFSTCNDQYAKEVETFHQCTAPKLGPIYLEDIQWSPKTRKGFGKMLTTMVAYFLSKSASKHTEDDVSNLCLMSANP